MRGAQKTFRTLAGSRVKLSARWIDAGGTREDWASVSPLGRSRANVKAFEARLCLVAGASRPEVNECGTNPGATERSADIRWLHSGARQRLAAGPGAAQATLVVTLTSAE